jgi:adenylate kinase family enzyme
VVKIENKLIIVEGLPGFGKTTAAKIIKNILDDFEIENELFLEGNLDHPADYDKVTHFNIKEYKKLLSDYPEYKSFIKKITEKINEDFFIHYHKQKSKYQDDFSDEIYEIISKNDVYELPFKKNKRLIVNNWNKFSKTASSENKVYIFECCFIQNPVTVSLIRDNKNFKETFNYITELLDVVRNLNPILFYIDQEDLDFTFKKIVNERSQEWLVSFIDYYTKQGYGLDNNLTGLKGALEVFKYRYSIENKIFKKLKMNKNIINNTGYNKKQLKKNIVEKLENNINN